MTTETPYHPQQFGAIVARSFDLSIATARNAGVLSLLVLLPLEFLLDNVSRDLFTAVASVVATSGLPGPESDPQDLVRMISPITGIIFTFYLAYILYLFGLIYAQTATTIFSWEAMSGYRPDDRSGLHGTLGRPFWLTILQSILIGIMLLSSFFAVMLITAIGRAITPAIGGLALVGSGLTVAYFGVVTVFRIHEIVVDSRGPWRGLISSMMLVRNNWWRVAAMVIILAVAFVFFTSLLPNLVSGHDFMGMFAADSAVTTGTEAQQFVAVLEKEAEVYTWQFSLVRAIGTALTLLWSTNLLTSLYFDLRVRRGDFNEGEREE